MCGGVQRKPGWRVTLIEAVHVVRKLIVEPLSLSILHVASFCTQTIDPFTQERVPGGLVLSSDCPGPQVVDVVLPGVPVAARDAHGDHVAAVLRVHDNRAMARCVGHGRSGGRSHGRGHRGGR